MNCVTHDGSFLFVVPLTLFGCRNRILVGRVVFSDVVRGISVTQFIGVGHRAR